MDRIKKKLLTMLLLFVTLIGINTLSKAYTVGQWIWLGYGSYRGSSNVYCLQHGQRLTYAGTSYQVASIVKIKGTVATDHTGKQIDNWGNAKLAAIINSTRPKFYSRQYAIWNYAYTWMENVGKHLNGLYSGFAYNVHGGYTPVDQESTDYANSVKNTEDNKVKFKDRTDRKGLQDSAESMVYRNESYIKVGPFKWDYSGNITNMNIKVTSNTGKVIKNILYMSYNGKTKKVHSKNDIPSNKDFYMLIPSEILSDEIEEIKVEIKVKNKLSYKGATLVFCRAADWSFQNMLIADPNSYEEEKETDLRYTIKIPQLEYGNIRVLKRDAVTGEPLAGAVFTCRNTETGVTGTKTTGADGVIVFSKVNVGTTFEITEIKAPNGYQISFTPISVTIPKGENTREIIVYNSKR